MSIVKRTHPSGCSWEISFSYREPDDTIGRFRRRFALENERAARELADKLLTGARRDGTAGIRRELEELLGTRKRVAPTLAQFAERFLDEYCRARNRPAVIEQRRIHLRVHWIPALGELPLDRITEEHLIRYRRDKLAGLDGSRLAASTLQSHFRTLSKLYHCARDWGVIGREDGPPIRLPRQARLPEIGDQWLRPEEEQRLVAFLLGLPVTDPRRYWTAPVLLALRTGLRQGEIRALRHRDLYYYGDTLMVRVCRTAGNRSHLFFATKDEDERVVPVSACARWELERLGFGRPRDGSRGESAEDLLWPGSRGPELAQCKNRMNRAFRELLAAAGITRHLTWHGLRHTFGTRLAHKYGDLRVVQSLLGHSSLKTTEIYLHVAPTAAVEAVNCLDDYADAQQARIIPWAGDDRQTKGGRLPATIPRDDP